MAGFADDERLGSAASCISSSTISSPVRVAESYFPERLQPEFGDGAAAQLDTAINWARYAELFAFDDGTGELYLET